MRLSFVSDIHGNIGGLADVARRVEQLVVLGDLLDYVDYHDPSAGIIGRIFGADRVRPFIALRLAGDFPALRAYNHRLWEGVDDPLGTLTDVVATRYREVLDAVGPDHPADPWQCRRGRCLERRRGCRASIPRCHHRRDRWPQNGFRRRRVDPAAVFHCGRRARSGNR